MNWLEHIKRRVPDATSFSASPLWNSDSQEWTIHHGDTVSRCIVTGREMHEHRDDVDGALVDIKLRDLGLLADDKPDPDWQRRADDKEFRVGDVCVRTMPDADDHESWKGAKCGGVFAVHETWPAGGVIEIVEGRRYCHREENVALLRPVDWTPRVGERVVCVGAPFPAVVTLSEDDGERWGVRGAIGQWVDKDTRLAPAVLAEPLIPLLRGDSSWDDVTPVMPYPGPCSKPCDDCDDCDCDEPARSLTPCPRCQALLDDGEGNHASPCRGCGYPGLKSSEAAMVVTTKHIEFRRLRSAWQTFGAPLNARGDTLAEQHHRSLYPDAPYSLQHCKRCGSDAGCMCGRLR